MQFSGPNGPLAQNYNFFRKTVNSTFMYLLASFILQNFKKFLELIQSYKNTSFLLQIGPKMAYFPQNRIFSEKVATCF